MLVPTPVPMSIETLRNSSHYWGFCDGDGGRQREIISNMARFVIDSNNVVIMW